MSGREQIEEVKSAVDIVEIIGQSVALTRAGSSHKGLCPFHGEKTASFHVYPASKRWKCYGCNENGDVIAFVEKRDNVTFWEALTSLAERSGVQLRAFDARAEAQKKRLYATMEFAKTFFSENLWANEEVLAYARSRGMNDDSLRNFEIGYLPNAGGLLTYLKSKGVSVEEAVGAGLVRTDYGKPYDRQFAERLIFPIRDHAGHLVSFGARVLPTTPVREDGDKLAKFVNGPMTTIFNKGTVLYGLYQAIKNRGFDRDRTAVVVEGYSDVIIPHQAGYANVVAVMSAGLTAEHVKRIRNLVDYVVIALDPDAAGIKGAERGKKLIKDTLVELLGSEDRLGVTIKQLDLPPGKDPDEIVLEDPANWEKLVAESLSVLDHAFVKHAGLNLNDVKEKNAAWADIVPYMRALSNPLSIQHYKRKLKQLLEMDDAALETVLSQTRKVIAEPAGGASVVGGTAVIGPPPSIEMRALHAVLMYPDHYQRLVESGDIAPLTENTFINSGTRQLFTLFQKQPSASGSQIEAMDRYGEGFSPVLSALYQTALPTSEKELVEILLTLQRAYLRRAHDEAVGEMEYAQGQGDAARAQQADVRLREIAQARDTVTQALGALGERADAPL